MGRACTATLATLPVMPCTIPEVGKAPMLAGGWPKHRGSSQKEKVDVAWRGKSKPVRSPLITRYILLLWLSHSCSTATCSHFFVGTFTFNDCVLRLSVRTMSMTVTVSWRGPEVPSLDGCAATDTAKAQRLVASPFMHNHAQRGRPASSSPPPPPAPCTSAAGAAAALSWRRCARRRGPRWRWRRSRFCARKAGDGAAGVATAGAAMVAGGVM